MLRERFSVNSVDVVTGGAPCESFSQAGKRAEEDDRNTLFLNVTRIARAIDSKMFVFENVKGLFFKKKITEYLERCFKISAMNLNMLVVTLLPFI
ncbi:DNA cytosine methyltransferase [Listeria aquatica]|uniref:DNA cytosine methyltransferase n=1 Tax=Listeria aquatica TaxID=1494960 RepID=UPI0019D32570